jgi:hypothetical protein
VHGEGARSAPYKGGACTPDSRKGANGYTPTSAADLPEGLDLDYLEQLVASEQAALDEAM